MINLKKEKNPMPEQEPQVRATNFEEVAEGYTPQMAVNEAMRCLKCRKKPCTTGCPVMVNIPAFVEKVAESDFEAAYQIISETSALPRICGRVCPQENQCEGKCVQGVLGEPVAIGMRSMKRNSMQQVTMMMKILMKRNLKATAGK